MDVGEEVVDGEVVVGDRIVRDEAASSRAERSPKTLSPFSVQDSKGAVSEAYCPDVRCTPEAGMRKTAATQRLELVARGSRGSGTSL